MPSEDPYIQISPGRELSFSPAWSDDPHSLVFDCNSGDYWAVTSLVRAILVHLASTQGNSMSQLCEFGEEAGYDAVATTKVLSELTGLKLVRCR